MTGLEKYKAAFARDPRWVHLNNAGLAPISRPAHDAVVHWAERFYREGMHCNDDYMAEIERCRGVFAEFLNCDATSVAFFTNTAGPVSQVAFGLELTPRDEILTWDQEYGSNLHPWRVAAQRAGAKFRVLKSGENLRATTAELIAAITPATKVVAISWVQYQTGAITDLAAVSARAKEVGAWVVADVIQGVGQLPFDFKASGVDAVCGGSHKWLTSPLGAGYLALKRERVEALRPLMVGALTYGTCDDPAQLQCYAKSNADRFEPGSRPTMEIFGMAASMRLLREAGLDSIRAEIARLAGKLRRGIEAWGGTLHNPAPESELGAVVNFSPAPGLTNAAVVKALYADGISCILRGPGVRLSPHAFNTDDDIARVLGVLNRMRRD